MRSQKKPNLPISRYWISDLQNCENINFCGWSHPVYATLLWQTKETNILFENRLSSVKRKKSEVKQASLHTGDTAWTSDWFIQAFWQGAKEARPFTGSASRCYHVGINECKKEQLIRFSFVTLKSDLGKYIHLWISSTSSIESDTTFSHLLNTQQWNSSA